MCGIAGMLWFDPARPVSRGLLARMGEVLAHRGPDDAGLYVDGPIGLAHRRLGIIDLSAEGRQPLANEDETVWIVFNGEIYNFRALRPELERRGHRFRSRTDTEVILHLYEERGPACLEALQGMFALAVWDGRRRELFLARDRFGKKPLAYWADAAGIRFASEAKAILQDPALPVRPDPAGLVRYLTHGYVPGAVSAFRGIRQLPPAHYLCCRDGRITLHRYWQLPRPAPVERPAEAWCEEIRARLAEAVRARLVSDVPLGAFLSGGIDSSAVVAMMARAGAGRVKSFCVGFPEREYDERRHARLVAERFGTEHHELAVEPDAAAVLPTLAWHFDEPFGDSSAVPTYYVARLTRQHVTVALGGDGGDEVFGGYERYLAVALAGELDRLPAAGLLRALAGALGRLLPRTGSRRSLVTKAARFLAGAGEAPGRRYAHWVCQFHGEAGRELCTPELLGAAGQADEPLAIFAAAGEAAGGTSWEGAQAADLALYLPDDLLRKVDIASMASGLEVRSPFLDHTLVEFAGTIPAGLKIRGRTTKQILRTALAGLLPPPILARPKMGFGVPIDHWLRGELRELVADCLLSPRALGRGYFRPATVRRLVEEHAAGRANWRDRLWTLLMLELWHRTFLDGDGVLAGQRQANGGQGGC